MLRPLSYFAPVDEGRYLILDKDPARTAPRGRPLVGDATPSACRAFHARLERIVDLLRAAAAEDAATTPAAAARPDDRAWARQPSRASWACRARRDLLDLFGKSAGDMLDGWFETDVLKGLLGFDAIVGNYASPYTPGSAYVLLHHVFGEANGVKGAWGHAIGGMGSITQAMARGLPSKPASRSPPTRRCARSPSPAAGPRAWCWRTAATSAPRPWSPTSTPSCCSASLVAPRAPARAVPPSAWPPGVAARAPSA